MKTLSEINPPFDGGDESGPDYSPSDLLILDEDESDESEAVPSSEPLVFVVGTSQQGMRLDQVVADCVPQHSRNRLQTWIKEGRLTVDGQVICEPKRKAHTGQKLVLTEAPSQDLTAFQPENIPLDIVFEDEHLLVINKPAGLVVHPGSGNWQGTLLNALLFHYPPSARIPRAGIVHRLDKETSGLMVVAKTLEAQTDLVRQLQARSVKRLYLALVQGVVERRGKVDAPIGRHPTQRTKMAVVPNGKPAITHYRVMETLKRWTLVECSLETGRTHQIRVHMAHLGYPLVGDPVYGKPQKFGLPFERQALHAFRLGLVHPATGEAMAWSVEWPSDMAELVEQARVA